MKKTKTIKSIKESNESNKLITACLILEHRPNLYNKQRQGYNVAEERLNMLPKSCQIHNSYRKGYEDGYRYAIERLKKHI